MARILTVDDAAFMRKVIKDTLSKAGYTDIHEAEDGAQAVEKYNELKPDLVLMDIQMPVMNGFEATRAIRKLPRADAAAIPIIALSANVSVEDVAISRKSGMNGHLAKPLDIPQLRERMAYWLDKN